MFFNKDKKPDEIYCPECGKIIKKNTIICPHCGIQVKELKTTSTTPVKSKTVAVVLAIFFPLFLGCILTAEMRLNFGFTQ